MIAVCEWPFHKFSKNDPNCLLLDSFVILNLEWVRFLSVETTAVIMVASLPSSLRQFQRHLKILTFFALAMLFHKTGLEILWNVERIKYNMKILYHSLMWFLRRFSDQFTIPAYFLLSFLFFFFFFVHSTACLKLMPLIYINFSSSNRHTLSRRLDLDGMY